MACRGPSSPPQAGPKLRSLHSPPAGAATTAVLFAGAKTAIAASAATPALTLPFCAVASCCHLLHDGVAGLQLAAAPHSPEQNTA